MRCHPHMQLIITYIGLSDAASVLCHQKSRLSPFRTSCCTGKCFRSPSIYPGDACHPDLSSYRSVPTFAAVTWIRILRDLHWLRIPERTYCASICIAPCDTSTRTSLEPLLRVRKMTEIVSLQIIYDVSQYIHSTFGLSKFQSTSLVNHCMETTMHYRPSFSRLKK